MHWFRVLTEKFAASERMIDECKSLYPDLPIEQPEGCGEISKCTKVPGEESPAINMCMSRTVLLPQGLIV